MLYKFHILYSVQCTNLHVANDSQSNWRLHSVQSHHSNRNRNIKCISTDTKKARRKRKKFVICSTLWRRREKQSSLLNLHGEQDQWDCARLLRIRASRLVVRTKQHLTLRWSVQSGASGAKGACSLSHAKQAVTVSDQSDLAPRKLLARYISHASISRSSSCSLLPRTPSI